jgi:hypothetical protein
MGEIGCEDEIGTRRTTVFCYAFNRERWRFEKVDDPEANCTY